MDPSAPDPLLRSFEQHPYAKNRSARTVTNYLIAVRQADTFCAAAAPAWRPSPGLTSRRS